MSTHADAAEAMFRQGYNCAQAVLSACGGPMGVGPDLAARLGQAYGGGIAGTGDLCGAVSGALMVLGLHVAMVDPKDPAPKARNHELARELLRQFRRRNGSVVCRDLLGCDIGTPQGRRQAVENGLFTTVCPRLVRDAVEVVDAAAASLEGKNP
jgi:C_GCAxxG_C_C family probable redox protein